MIKRFFILLLAIVASVGMSFAQASIVSSGTKGGMSYTFYDNGLLEISGSGALPGSAFTNWDGGFGTSVKNIRFAEDCEVYGLDYLWFACYTENSQLETVEINSVAPIMFSGTSGAGIFYRQDGAVTLTITAPGIVDVENRIIDNYGSPVNMIFNMPATTVFEKKWFSGLENYFAVTIPTGATGHIPAGYVFKDSYDQEDYDHLVADGYEDIFWDTHSYLVEGVDYTLGVESTFVITAENASQIFGKATVSFQAPTEASNSEWVLWRKSDLKEFPDMSSGDQKVYKDVTVKVNNGVYNTNSGYGVHFESLAEDGVQFVAPEGKVFKRIVILNGYGTFSDSNWSYDSNYKRWSGSANTVGFEGDICGISLIEFELEASAPANSCGGGLTWELNNGELVISYDGEGTGVMNDYDIPNDNPAPWYANREDITSVSLPEGIKTIGKDAFRDCVNLTTVTIPNSVTTIGESAFVTVEHLETVTIGTGITSIVNGAFYGNAELTTVTCSATTPPSIGAMVFGSCTNLEHIYVPAESVDAYKTAWSDYASIISAASGGGTPDGALSGAFTINANGDKIVFSRGNLQAKTTDLGANWTWDFAPNQWSLIGDAVANNAINGNKTVSANGTVDLFGWSTAATYYGINKSWNNDDYAGDFVDWGALMGTEWRTLSRAEFRYIVFDRAQAFNKQGKATVNGVSGYIFLPDAWTLPSGLSFTPSPSDYTTNQYDGANWEAMEAAGAVFLPAAGDRSGTDIYMYDYGWYWTSTSTVDDKAYYLYFYEKSRDFVEHNRYDAKSVRLVTAAPIPPYEAAIKLIDAIGTVELTAECKAKIDAARTAYDALSDGDKDLVTNIATLTQAETDYAALNQAEADKVVAKIAAIPQPVTLKLATRDSIESARAAYEALNAEQKALVPAAELQKLTDAEAELATLNPGGGAPLPEGALTGAFSINAGGDKIAFSKGNLQATYGGSDWTWAFAAHQYDYIGNAVANTAITGSGTVSANGTVDLFGWSTAATYYGINNTNVSGKHSGDFIDWGETIAEGWRTLTRDEWGYLFETRTDAASKYGHATVAGIHGIIVLPDSYKGTAINADHSDWSNNIISAEDWAAYEANGVAFLPAAGSRLATSVSYVGEYAFYWTSTTYGEKWAYRVRFVPDLSPDYGDRVPGQSVRLVTAHTGSATPLDSAQVVKDLIEAIPAEITLDAACVNAVQAARDAYNALTEATKGALDAATVNKLNQAITDYTALIQAGADAVIAKIAAIPQPVTLKLATRDSIDSARAAYDALNADQKALVSNYDVLLDAEATWAGLTNVAPAGALSGKYTINDGGDVIYFAHGNLQYTRENLDADWSTGTFRLAENQYDLIELVKSSPDSYCTDNYGDKTAVGLFGWGTWGEGKTPNLTSSDRSLYTWSTDFSGTLEGTDTWRTLTKDEWVYLLAHNNQSYATVHGVNGLLVAPDGKDIDGKSMTDWVEINDETWTTMQNDGYLFLPACGQRSQLNSTANIITGGQGTEILYYSSTQYSDVYAHNIWYKPGQDPAADDYSNKRQAFGIRLVSAGINPLDQAQAVKDLIDAIPAEITLDDACVNAIQAARDAYDALSEDAQGIIDAATVQKLTDAEEVLMDLNQAEADKVVAKINNIPLPVELKLATRDSINNARAAYDALNAAQQALVTNYQTLLDAEAALAEKNQGGSASVDIVWDINTGIANVNQNTTSPAYDGITITTGNGNRFYQTTTDPTMLRFFFTGGKGSYAFAQEDGTHFTKVALISSVAMGEWLREPSRIGTDWVVSDDYKKATWIGDADTVKIWDGAGATAWVDVDSIVFTVNASSTPLDSAQAVKELIDAILTPVEYPTSGAAIEAALNAYNELSDAAKGALDDADVQKLNDAATQYPALEAIAAIEAIPAEIVYDPAVKAAIENAREKYDALTDASKALVSAELQHKLTNAEEAWAILAAKVEHNVTYIGKEGILKQEVVALLHIPDPAPDFNGYEFVRWDIKQTELYNEGVAIKAVYAPIITTDPVAYDTLEYNGLAQELVIAGVAKEGHIEYSLYPEEPESWSANLPTATNAAAYVVYYKLVREGHEDYMAGNITVVIAKTQVSYTAPVAYDTLVYNYNMQTLIEAGITNDGIFEYTLTPGVTESWNVNLPQAQDAGTYAVYYRVIGDINHFDSTAVAPVAVTIAKRDIVVEAPVAYDTLVYNAAEQTLVIAGSADFNVMEYSLDTTVQNCWSIELPKAVTADPYTVYYRVPGDDNHNEYEAQSIVAFIAQAPLTITAEDSTIIYGDAVPEFIATYSGWQGQDDETVVSNLAFSCAYQQGSYIGTYVISPHSATAHNYAISFVNGTLTVNKAHVYVSGAEAYKAKFADGHAIADVTKQGILNGIKLNDPIAHVTTAAFSSAEVAENLDITLFYELTGDAALLNNYYLDPTSDIFTHEGVIIEPFLPDNDDAPEDEEATVEEGIEVYAYGYCDGEDYKLKYHLNSGYPNQYKIEFEDSRFANVDWTPLTTTGRDGTIDINIPVDLRTGDYTMTVTFRDSRFPWLPSEPFNVTFHVNLPETYVVVLLDNTIALIDTCHCLTDVQWYHRNDASELWQPIEGATDRYYFENGGLTGEYFVKAKMNGVDTYTCPQTDVETLYDGGKKMAVVVRAYPSPAIDRVEVSIENSDVLTHMMTIVNMMGSEIEKRMFNGNKTTLDVSGYQSGNYMISVDGNVVKVIKK